MSRIKSVVNKVRPLSSRQRVFKKFSDLEKAMYFNRPPVLDSTRESRGMRLFPESVDSSFSMGQFLGHDYILVDRQSSDSRTLVIEVDLHTLYPFNHFLVYKNSLPPKFYSRIQQIYMHHRPAPISSGEGGMSKAFDKEYTILSKPEHFSRSIFFMHDAPSKTLLDMKGDVIMEVTDKSLFMYDYSNREVTPSGLQVFVRTACTMATLLESRIK